MIPTGRLVVLACVPLTLAALWLAHAVPWPVVAGVDVALALVAAVDALRSGARVEATRSHAGLQSVGRPLEITLTLRQRGGRPLPCRVDDDGPGQADGLPAALTLPPDAVATLVCTRTVHRRGRYVFGRVAVRWASPWGLWWRQARLGPDGDELRVYPDFAFLRRHALQARADEQRLPVRARRRPGGESEFERLRPYVPGDPYRHVDWRATARRQQVVVREYGQEVNQNVVFLLDAGRAMTARHGELVAFDHALNAALALGHAALRHGDRVGLLAFDREVRAWAPPRGGLDTATRLVRATYDVFPSLDEPDPVVAFRHLQGTVRRRSLVVYLTAMTDRVNADAATAVVRALGSRHLPVTVWLRDPALDAVIDAPADPGSEAWYHRAAAAELLRWRADALATWRRAGALVVDCAPDRLTGELLSRYLEVKARRML